MSAVPALTRVRHCTSTHDWAAARRAAFDVTDAIECHRVAIADAVGAVLAEPLGARSSLPAFRTAAMDGWAVAGPGPWRLVPGQLLAGSGDASLVAGTACVIATGAAVPLVADGVLRSEDGRVDGDVLEGALRPGLDCLPAGGECSAGELLLPAGEVLSPPAVGLAAACGHDDLLVRRVPQVVALVFGDELISRGLPGNGRIRDSLTPQLPGWIRALGGEPAPPRRVPDSLAQTAIALLDSESADVVVTTGGTASGPVDHLHAALREVGADIVVDGVAVRPGHPMLLARLRSGTPVVGLPGNPLAACVGMLTLLAPVLERRSGRARSTHREGRLAAGVAANGADCRLVPVAVSARRWARPLPHAGSAMLRGLALANALAVVPPTGAVTGARVALIELPWASGAVGG